MARLLTIHVPSMLPVDSADLDVPEMVQTASLVALGLLYQGMCSGVGLCDCVGDVWGGYRDVQQAHLHGVTEGTEASSFAWARGCAGL